MYIYNEASAASRAPGRRYTNNDNDIYDYDY